MWWAIVIGVACFSLGWYVGHIGGHRSGTKDTLRDISQIQRRELEQKLKIHRKRNRPQAKKK